MARRPLSGWLEALPVVTAGAAAVLYGPSLALSTTFGLFRAAIAVYALLSGARVWAASLGLVLNVPLALAAAHVLLGAL